MNQIAKKEDFLEPVQYIIIENCQDNVDELVYLCHFMPSNEEQLKSACCTMHTIASAALNFN